MNTGIDKRARILLVDDESANIAVLAATLDVEYALSVALNGQEALQVLAQGPRPDLILLDVMMPGMSGFDVCKTLSQDPELSQIPVIFVTAMNDEANEEAGLALGAVDYIYKPINPAILRTRVRIHMNLRLQRDFLQALLDQRSRDLEQLRNQARELLGEGL